MCGAGVINAACPMLERSKWRLHQETVTRYTQRYSIAAWMHDEYGGTLRQETITWYTQQYTSRHGCTINATARYVKKRLRGIRNNTTLQHRYGGVRSGACAAPRIPAGKPGEGSQKDRRECLHSSPDFWMASQAYANDIPFFQLSFSIQAAGASPRPTKSCTSSFVPSCFGRTLSANAREPHSPAGVKGRNAPCAGARGRRAPTVPLATIRR